MNAIKNFLGSLLPVTESNRINKELETILTDLVENVLPMLAIEGEPGKNTKLYKEIDGIFRQGSFKVEGYRGNLIRFLHDTVKDRVAEADKLRRIFEGRFKNDVLKEALDYESANLLHYLEGINYFSKYARRLVLVLTQMEIGDAYKPIDKDYMDFVKYRPNIQGFAIMSGVLTKKFETIAGSLIKLRDISFDVHEVEAMQQVNGIAKMDPLKMGFLPPQLNPGYWIGTAYNTYVAWRYDIAKEQRTKLELHLIYLKRQAEGATEEDLADLQKQIDYYSNHLNKLTAKIEEIEEDAGIKR